MISFPSTSVNSFNDALDQNLDVSYTIIPYQIIRNIAKNKMQEAIDFVNDNIYNEVIDNKKFQDCVVTANIVSIIFLGLEKMKKYHTYEKNRIRVDFEIDLPSGNKWSLSIDSLFDGNISHDINNDSSFNQLEISDQIESSNKYRVQYIKKFISEIDLEIKKDIFKSDEQIIDFISKNFILQYPFNKTTADSLIENVANRNEKVNNKQSFIYVCRLKISKAASNGSNIEHAWVMEQFFSEKTRKVAFRCYQSWLDFATLSNDFDKRQYGDHEENIWGVDEFNEFLNNLNDYFVSPSIEKLSKCFGYPATHFPSIELNGHLLSGKYLTYRIFEIDPEQCIGNSKFI